MRVLVNDRLDRLDLHAAMPLLPSFRREQALRFRREIDRRQSVAAWLLLREACRRELGLDEVPPLAWTEKGKPWFPSLPGVHFNLSHCPEAAVCAMDSAPVGIDVEAVRPLDEDLLAHVMSPAEQAEILADAAPGTAFMRFWTRKESILKLTGEGLCDTLPSLLENTTGVRTRSVTAPDGRYVYTLASFSEP